MRYIELFGGIGALTQALKNLKIDAELVDYVEIDKYAIKSFNAMNGTNFEPQDITKWDKDLKDIDLIMHGSPCQDFSVAGKQAGGDEGSGTRSSLMYETLRIVNKLKPKYVIWENVKNVLSKTHKHNFDNYINQMEQLGYTNYYKVLNAKDFNIPQNRERVFTISVLDNQEFEFPEKEELKLKLKDILEDKVEEKYYLKKTLNIEATKNYLKWDNSGKGYNSQQDRAYYQDGLCPTLSGCNNGDKSQIVEMDKTVIFASRGRYNNDGTTSQRFEPNLTGCTNTLTTVQKDNFLVDNSKIRKLTPKECWRLMGFSDEDFEKAAQVNSNTQLYKQAGNSIVVNVLEAILNKLLEE